jgi:hypothetical protein
VQLGEELDAILAREHLIHHTAEMIATKTKGKHVSQKLKKKKNVKNCQKVVKKLLYKNLKLVKL